jgi:hypothetical protein
MPEIREQLAEAILDAMRNSVGEYDTPYIDGGSLEWTCIDGRVDMLAAAEALMQRFNITEKGPTS